MITQGYFLDVLATILDLSGNVNVTVKSAEVGVGVGVGVISVHGQPC